MNKSYKPDGYPSISPYLIVADADQTIQFMSATFGATELRRFLKEDGGESILAPVQKDDDDKRSGVKDAGGTTWWISTQVS